MEPSARWAGEAGCGPRLVGYHRLSDKDIGVTRKDPTASGRCRPGYEEVLRLVDAHAVDVALCWKWDRFIHEPLDLEYLIPRFDKAGARFAEADGNIDLGTRFRAAAAAVLGTLCWRGLNGRRIASDSRRRLGDESVDPRRRRQIAGGEAIAHHGHRNTGIYIRVGG